jgi:hypothetical protein
VKRRAAHRNFQEALELLRAHGFEVSPYSGVDGGVLVSKHGAGAVLAPPLRAKGSDETAPMFALPPGVMVKGEVTRLVDRGYQKFIKSSQYELPASASQLQGIHAFSEELKLLIGAVSLYNESLGTTSDVYQYDRLTGREAEQPQPEQPWAAAEEH